MKRIGAGQLVHGCSMCSPLKGGSSLCGPSNSREPVSGLHVGLGSSFMERTGHHGPKYSFGSMGEDVLTKAH